MVSKNNRLERIRKIEEKSERHSIRKFTVGAASVLIGLSFLGVSGVTVNASDVNQEATVLQETSGSKDVSEDVSQAEVKTEEAVTTEASQETNVVAQTENTSEQADAPPVSESSASVQESAGAQDSQAVQESSASVVSEAPAVEEAPVSESAQPTSEAQSVQSSSTAQLESTAPAQVESSAQVENSQTSESASQTVNTSEEVNVQEAASQVSEKQAQAEVKADVPAVAAETSTKMTYDEAKEEVDKVNQEVNSELDNIINEANKVDGVVIEVNTVDPEKVFNTTVADIKINIEKLKEYTEAQIKEISATLKKYQDELALAESIYNKEMEEYNKAREEYIAKLKELGLWNDDHTDPGDLSQSLVIGKEENATVTTVIKNPNVTESSGSKLNGLLNHFFEINGAVSGDFLEVTYSGLQNSNYADQKIDKIVITFSDWTTDYTGYLGNKNDKAGIYFGDCPTNGFFYAKADGVTMDMKLYNSEGKLINLADNSAFITVGSLNSEVGKNDNYVEKAEIVNGADHGGSGVALPESSITIHQGQYGDVLYSDKYNNILNHLTATNYDEAVRLWGQAAVDKYLNWDDTSDRTREIFGSGLFKVHGNSIKIRFSNKVGSAWATYSTTIPEITFSPEKPEFKKPDPVLIVYTPGKLQLNANGTVHIHYVDVHDKAQSGQTSFIPDDGKLLNQSQHILHLAVGDNYSNELWDYIGANYELATDSVHPEATNGEVSEGEKHVYVYLKRKTQEASRDKVVTQTIHYVYENGDKAAETVNKTITFTQSGVLDLVTNQITWNGEWTPTQTFVTVVSPDIKGYTADKAEVGPYDITVNNSNVDDNLDKNDIVVYKANATETINRDKVVNQTIQYVYENGDKAAETYTYTITFTQSGVRDTVTGEETWNGEWTPTQTLVVVKSPDIKGYHTDTPEVGPYDITVTNDNFNENLDKNDVVVYKANATETINRDKVVNQTIHYVYEDGTKAAETYTVQITFTQTGAKDLVTGEETWDGEWTPTQTLVVVKSPTVDGYTPDKAEVGPYNITVTNDNFNDNLDKVDIVVYKKNAPQTETISRDKYVTQTIHYIYEDGTEAAPTVIKTIKFTQSGVKNLATGEETWDGEWTATQTFVVVKSPTIDGYTANKAEVGPYDITVTNDNYNDNLNKDDIVVYKKNVTPTPDPAPEPKPEPEPEKPTKPEEPETPEVPTPDPEEPKEDDKTDIPPKDETSTPVDSDPSDDSDKSDESENVESKDDDTETPTEIEPKDETSPSSVNTSEASTPNTSPQGETVVSTQVEEAKATPELVTVSAKSTKEAEKPAQVAVNQDALPQTGAEETNKAGVFGLLIASLASVFGLAAGKKRKKR
ncbi:GbpC/Spa domain-containing protein [Lactobacillus sp. LL6]|uniref:mucin-binding protein n=1 Tax=Lactobacillus sp. LL6 TaxID=2596827 RepID=UPI001186A24E|nr:GbpC/Spa domain-containing protein [Lactobacillus sp. LL6]TSO26583.1 YSIRK-type signal peptide-containing protein [Lactobacillus sp. LL6]